MTSADEEGRKQLRRLQNRVNQRARRSRLREKDNQAKTLSQGPYKISRWRLLGGNSIPGKLERTLTTHVSASESISTHSMSMNKDTQYHRTAHCNHPARATQLCFPVPSPRQDLLLNLIHFNVLRGLFDNKVAIMDFVAYFSIGSGPYQPPRPYPKDVYPARAVILPMNSGSLPPSLYPTELQMTVEHPTWIDSLPFPRMRENFIRMEADCNHHEFAKDIVGNLFNFTMVSDTLSVAANSSVAEELTPLSGDDEITTTRRGFIVWGEPHNPANWEVTPSFLEKWRWAMEGCEKGLIESSNHWRRVRGEDPLSLHWTGLAVDAIRT